MTISIWIFKFDVIYFMLVCTNEINKIAWDLFTYFPTIQIFFTTYYCDNICLYKCIPSICYTATAILLFILVQFRTRNGNSWIKRGALSITGQTPSDWGNPTTGLNFCRDTPCDAGVGRLGFTDSSFISKLFCHRCICTIVA